MRIKRLLQNKKALGFILGAISALAFAPLHFIFAAVIGFSGLFLLIDKIKDKKELFVLGWYFGFGHFLVGLYWISIALLVDIAKFAWLLPFVISLIPAALACYIGLTTLSVNLLADKAKLTPAKKVILFALIWVFFEFIRSNFIFGGFPWNLIGYSFVSFLTIAQIASVFGIYGLSLLAIILCTTPALFIKVKDQKLTLHFERKNLFITIFAVILLISSLIYGNWHLSKTPTNSGQSIILRLVQPAIKQQDKWDPRSKYDSFMENVELSRAQGFENIDLVIWSESAIPYIVDQDNDLLLEAVTKAIPKKGFLISGGLRAEFGNLEKSEIKKIWNSIFVINNSGQIISSYDKANLVPFGEYIPFEKFLPFISKITDGGISFSRGLGPQTIKINDKLPSFSPLVCYEIIYTDKVVNKSNPPQFLINLTNDAWFGKSSGPYQHLAMTKIRAIEYGIPVVRVANSGISALIDPNGRIIEQLNLNKKGVIDVKLNTSSTHAIYSQNGTNTPLILAYFILLLILL
jgi:apolipoprotein N-acyltransferase